jgi:hypothetical protein
MVKWIYKYVMVPTGQMENLDVLGAEGWEACAFAFVPGDPMKIGVLLKRGA